MEVAIRPHSLWSLCRVATTSSIPWDKIVSSVIEFWILIDKVVNGIDQLVNSLRFEFEIDNWMVEGQKVLNVLKQLNCTCPDSACYI